MVVADAAEAYAVSTANGAVGVQPPAALAGAAGEGGMTVAEVKLYGDVVLRFVSGDFKVGSGVGGGRR